MVDLYSRPEAQSEAPPQDEEVVYAAPKDLPVVLSTPLDAPLTAISPKPSKPVRAELAKTSGEINTGTGVLRYEKGQHYIVRYSKDDTAPVERSIFESTYTRVGNGRYQKRDDLILFYFTFAGPVMVETREGMKRAEAGDWIVQGVEGELYCMPAKKGAQLYRI